MKNSDKIILDLCGGTGAWSKPYKDNGYDVRLITLPGNDIFSYVPPGNVYGILAAPMCTQFSLARTRAKTERNLKEGIKMVRMCQEIIWHCRYKPLYKKNGALHFWALENPMGLLRQFLGLPALSFNAYDYGDLWCKKTDIWGYFKIPRKLPKMKLDLIDRKKIQNIGGSNKNKKLLRSVTPPGFAKAFYKANK